MSGAGTKCPACDGRGWVGAARATQFAFLGRLALAGILPTKTCARCNGAGILAATGDADMSDDDEASGEQMLVMAARIRRILVGSSMGERMAVLEFVMASEIIDSAEGYDLDKAVAFHISRFPEIAATIAGRRGKVQ